MQVNKKDMTSDIANKYLTYDVNTGYLYRKFKYHNNVIKGKRACRPCNNKNTDHLEVTLQGRNYPAHRVIWIMQYGNFPSGYIDHINHDETDNKLSNLREVSQRDNNKNQSKRKDNTSGTTGVWISKNNGNKKFIAEIFNLERKKVTKSFYSIDEAIQQRREWELEFNYHSNHGIDKP